MRLGRRAARWQFGGSLMVAFLVPLAFVGLGYGWTSLLPILAAPIAWQHARRLRESKTPSELIALLGDTGKLLALYALLLATGLVL